MSAAQNLGNDGFAATVSIDGATGDPVMARAVVVGNCSALTAGLTLFPDAALDDGVLDVATLTPQSLAAWAAVATRVLCKDVDGGPSIQRQQGRDVVVSIAGETRVEADGDVFPPAKVLPLVVDLVLL